VTLELPASFPGVITDAGVDMTYGVIAHADPGSSTITDIVAPTYLFSLS